MEKHTSQASDTSSLTRITSWHHWLIGLVLVLFVLQLGWLVWQLRGDLGDMARRVRDHSWGAAVRQEDPFYRWVAELERDIPPGVTYIFLDNYEAGKEVEARYHLYPREHLLLLPESPPSLLFYTLRENHVTYIFVRDAKQPPGPGLQAALDLGAAKRLNLPGPGLVYRVDPKRIHGGFYD
jgi:hypothetical protein